MKFEIRRDGMSGVAINIDTSDPSTIVGLKKTQVVNENALLKLSVPIVAVVGEKESEGLATFTPLTGYDVNTKKHYYFFQSLLEEKKYHGKSFFVNNEHLYELHIVGEVRVNIEELLKFVESNNGVGGVLPIFNKEWISKQNANIVIKEEVETEEVTIVGDDKTPPYELAKEVLRKVVFKRYNENFYYFDYSPGVRAWQELNIEKYDTQFNRLFHLITGGVWSKGLKEAVRDALVPYLYDTNEVEDIKELNTNLILFKNKRVLDISTMKSREFMDSDFIFHTLDANWYDDNSDELKMLNKPNEYLEALLNGVAGISDGDLTRADDFYAKKRREDLLTYIGFTLSNERKEANTLIMYGRGRNGKSTLARIIYELKNSSTLMELNAFLTDNFSAAGYAKNRFLYFDELEKGNIDDKFLGKFKGLTGSDLLNVRPMQKESRDVKTNFVVYITTNKLHEMFVKDPALSRRTKIVNATKAAKDWHNPKDDFVKGVMQQSTKDYLANHCIRKFVREAKMDISGLFSYDKKSWAVAQVPNIKNLLSSWKRAGWANLGGDLEIPNDDLIHLLLTADQGISGMLKARPVVAMDIIKGATIFGEKVSDDEETKNKNDAFDDQMFILFRHILNLSSTNCTDGYARYERQLKNLKPTMVDDDEKKYILTEFDKGGMDTNNFYLKFKEIKGEKDGLIIKEGAEKFWIINKREEYTIDYVLRAVFGWDGRDESEWIGVLEQHIKQKTKFKIKDVGGSVVLFPNKYEEEYDEEREDDIPEKGDDFWYFEVKKQVKQTGVAYVGKRKEIVNSFRHKLSDEQMAELYDYINTKAEE